MYNRPANFTVEFWQHQSGADPGGVNWVASQPPLGCAVSIIFFVWALSDLLEQTILVNEVCDEMQINHSDRVNTTYLEQESQTA